MTMHDCPDGEARDLLPLYLRARLSAEDRARVEAHLTLCADCAAEADLLRDVARAYDVPQVDTAAIVARITGRHLVPSHASWRLSQHWRAAAGLLLMVGAVAVATLSRGKPGPPPSGDSAVSMAGGAGPAGAAAGGSALADPDRAIGLGVSLADLTDAQLDDLLRSLDEMDGRVLPDPERMSRALVPSEAEP